MEGQALSVQPMTKANLLLLSLFLFTTLSIIAASNDYFDTGPNCTCDTTVVLEAIKADDFNRIPKYDSPDFDTHNHSSAW